ncbi:hypothetical protein AVEN_237553-1 [Araneus ventricosus]|uniref:Uncharacterized protein n=1 Tax=Araneus ventricosus TaxID=182803 RepID=A0A4Y2WRK6_ARAVE|nr:hypothetical protein AVEN_237553-1 [Araneus ventricosus]
MTTEIQEGKKIFSPDEFLSKVQIQSLFARFARKRKEGLSAMSNTEVQQENTNFDEEETKGSTVQWSVYKGCPRASESISIVGVMQKRSDLSDVQKGMIIGFRAKGGSVLETANFVNCSRAAVVKVYRVWQYGTIQNQRHGTCGAPWAIDDRGE